MKPFSRKDYPQLSAFVGGYLHQDYIDDSGSPAGALDKFIAQANPEQRRALTAEFGAFMNAIEAVPFAQAQEWWTRELGSAWLPADKNELLALQRRLSRTDIKA
ncbi:MAG TPA: contact-dependent growth inhibition system immunity protein [Planctomycetota bacterium]|nr:contact-dependent growth inhibition system immunity protein [Planctomycetota bacterium]